jgi:hypothetical protein
MISVAIAVALAQPPPKGWPLLNDISKRTFNYFVERSHPVTGFTKDRSRNFQEKDTDDHVVASIAAIGFALSAYAVGEHRGWMSRSEAIKVSRKTLKHMIEVAPKHRGWFYHWLNWETGKKEWDSELSTIDSAIFWCGMITNERALKDPEITRMSNQILKAVDWKFMLTNGGSKPNKKTLTMGWRPNQGFLTAEWNGYFESAMLYLLMLGSDESIPADTWKGFERKHFKGYGQEVLTGGPLFLHQMSHIFFDFKGKRDMMGYDYWVSSRNNTLAQIEYAKQNPKKYKGYGGGIWGLSACDIPDGYGAQGIFGDWADNGTLAPPCAVASMMFTPKESLASAEAYVRLFPETYGKYSFVTGFNPSKGWVSKDMIGIDHGQMQLGIENARDGFPNKAFMSSPLVQRGMKRAGFRVTQEGPVEKRPLLIAPK